MRSKTSQASHKNRAPLTVRTTALLILRQHGESYLSEILEYSHRLGCDFAMASVQDALEKLEKDGFVVRDDVSGESSGRPRAYYKLTTRGHRESAELVERLSEICRQAA